MKKISKVIYTNTAERTFKRRVEDNFVLEMAEEILKKKRGYVIKIPEPKDPVVACISGGLDSVCNLEILMGEFDFNVYPYFLNRKQSNYQYEKNQWNFIINITKKDTLI